MQIRAEVKMVEREIKTYIADDGTEFSSRVECAKYEYELKYKKILETVKSLEIEDLKDILPINTSGIPNENNTFGWYEVKSEKDFEIIDTAYNNSLESLENYPEIICVELETDFGYVYTLTDCKRETEEFWRQLGYETTFKKI